MGSIDDSQKVPNERTVQVNDLVGIPNGRRHDDDDNFAFALAASDFNRGRWQ